MGVKSEHWIKPFNVRKTYPGNWTPKMIIICNNVIKTMIENEKIENDTPL